MTSTDGISILLFLLLVWGAWYSAGAEKEGGDVSPGALVPVVCVLGVVILPMRLVVLGIGADK